MKAALMIGIYYRRYKQRSYINNLFYTFRNVKSMPDYGKGLSWPEENFAVREITPILKNIYKIWRAWMILKPFPKKDWPQLKLKVFYLYSIQNLNQY